MCSECCSELMLSYGYMGSTILTLFKKIFICLFGCGVLALACRIFFQLQQEESLVAACKLLVAAYGIQFPNQAVNPGPPHWEGRILATGPPGKSPSLLFNGLISTAHNYFLLPLNTAAFLVMKVEPVAIKCVSTIFLDTSVVGSGKYLISILLVLVWPLSCAVSPAGLKQLHSGSAFVCFHYL